MLTYFSAGKPTIWANQSGVNTIALLAGNTLLLMGGLLLKNIDKIKSVPEVFVSKGSDKVKPKPETTIFTEENDYDDLLGAEKLYEMSAVQAVNRLMNVLVEKKFGKNVASRRTDVEEFLDRWRFVFLLPSMRKILPLLIKDPLKTLKSLFPSPAAIRKFIWKDLQSLISPPGIEDLHISPVYNKGPYKYETPIPDIKIVPNLNLLE